MEGTAATGRGEAWPAGPIRVLYVEDVPEYADVAASSLERADDRLEVAVETRSTDAPARIDGGAFDCVISDHDMSGLSGVELLETVRERHPALPFILFTSRSPEDVAEDALAAGVTDYLRKAPGTEQYGLLAHQVVHAVARYRAERRLEGDAPRIADDE